MFHGYSKFLKFVLLPTLVSYWAIGVAQEVELHRFSFQSDGQILYKDGWVLVPETFSPSQGAFFSLVRPYGKTPNFAWGMISAYKEANTLAGSKSTRSVATLYEFDCDRGKVRRHKQIYFRGYFGQGASAEVDVDKSWSKPEVGSFLDFFATSVICRKPK